MDTSQEHINALILVVAGDTLARHLQWIIEEPDSGLVPEVLAVIRQAATKDLAWWENCVKQAGFKSPATLDPAAPDQRALGREG